MMAVSLNGRPLTAVILAAGAGTRLGKLGQRYSKPMVALLGAPLIDWVIGGLRRAGVDRIVVVGHPADMSLASFLRMRHPAAPLVHQTERRGIADALRQALPLIGDDAGHLACACDSLFLVADLTRLIACGRAQPEAAAVGVLDMGVGATTTRSAVRVHGDVIVEIIEKPARDTAPSSLVAAPLYWLPRRFATYLDATPPVGGEAYVSTALNAFIEAGGIVHAVPISERAEVTTAADIAPAESWLRARAVLPRPP